MASTSGLTRMAKPAGDAAARGDGIDEGQFPFRLAVEGVNAVGQGVIHLFGGLADA